MASNFPVNPKYKIILLAPHLDQRVKKLNKSTSFDEVLLKYGKEADEIAMRAEKWSKHQM